jgi:cytochrome c oxidase cbb3-type subunit I/II
MVKSNIPTIATVKPYTPLELEGRDIYVREGCYTCHSQMVRPFRSETERYGEYSKPGEYIYDRPFQWGSKRTGPDLHREGVVGGKMYKTASWHYNHMLDPQKMNAKSIMPPYPWMITDDLDYSDIEGKLSAMQTLGVPYTDEQVKSAKETLMKQAEQIEADLKAQGIKDADKNKEIVALIAYLMRLGSDISDAK